MTGYKKRIFLVTILACAAASPAFAQTADGVGTSDGVRGGSGTRTVSAEEAAEDILDLAEYERKFYQVALRMWGIKAPNFVLGAFFDLHTNQWSEGVHNFAYGAEFTTRIPEKYDLVLSLDWANMRTPDGYWLEDGDPIADVTWTENNLSLITLDVAFHWLTSLDKRDTWQLYYGVGLGASIILGEFRKYDLDTAACGLDTAEQRNSRDVSLVNGCFDANGDPTVLTDYEVQSIPPILPSISATIGLRYLIEDMISVSLEGGFRGLYFYGGLEVGYFWEVQPRVD